MPVRGSLIANSAFTPPNLRSCTSMGPPRGPRRTNSPFLVPTRSCASAPPEIAGRMWMRSRAETGTSRPARSPFRNTFTCWRTRPRSSRTHPASLGNSDSSRPITSPTVAPDSSSVPFPPARSRSGARSFTSTMTPIIRYGRRCRRIARWVALRGERALAGPRAQPLQILGARSRQRHRAGELRQDPLCRELCVRGERAVQGGHDRSLDLGPREPLRGLGQPREVEPGRIAMPMGDVGPEDLLPLGLVGQVYEEHLVEPALAQQLGRKLLHFVARRNHEHARCPVLEPTKEGAEDPLAHPAVTHPPGGEALLDLVDPQHGRAHGLHAL